MKRRRSTVIACLYVILVLWVMGFAQESDYQDDRRLRQIGPQDYRVHVVRGGE